MAKKQEAVKTEETVTVQPSSSLADQLMAAATNPQAPSQNSQPIDIDGKSGADWIAEHGNKSNAIRHLASLGKKRGEIARCLDIRYQHVRNVLTQTLKRKLKDSENQEPQPQA